MIFFRRNCDNGCHRQGGVIAGPVQLEYGYAADAVRIGAEFSVHSHKGAMGVVVYFGPFQLGFALRWKPVPVPQ